MATVAKDFWVALYDAGCPFKEIEYKTNRMFDLLVNTGICSAESIDACRDRARDFLLERIAEDG